MDTQYMEILERLKTRHLLTSSAVDSLARTSALLEKAQELREAGLDFPKSGMMHSGSVYKVPSLDYNNVGKEYILLPTPRVSSANGSPQNRFFGSPTYRGNLEEYIRDGETDGLYPNPELSETLMGFPTSWTETNV